MAISGLVPVAEIAPKLDVSYSSLYRLCKDHLGLGPKRFCEITPKFLTQIKLQGSYPLPFNAQLSAWASGKPVPAPTAHKAQLAGNVITLDWTLDPNGFTEEENKVINETRKIMGDATIGVCPTCVRVPVRVAHSEAITVGLLR